MENSDSNSSKKQALRMQAEQLLPKITTIFLAQYYSEIVHQRLGQQQQNTEIIYQGLTRARHGTFGEVMVKWEISPVCILNLTGLTREIEVLKAIDDLPQQGKLTGSITRLLVHDTFSVGIDNQNQAFNFFVMPFYSQGSLATYLRQSLTHRQKLQCIIKAAQLIGNLHDDGWLHNDIKPSNILLNPLNGSNINKVDRFKLLLTDFALAQQINNVSRKNVDEEVFNAGTPSYVAPERWQGQSATIQSDIYAFGVMMYEILIGAKPFSIESQSDDLAQEWAIQHCQQPIPILPLAFELYQTIIDKAYAKKVENRYANMHDVLEDLQSIAIK